LGINNQNDPGLEDLYNRYKNKVDQAFSERKEPIKKELTSREYHQFRKELLPTKLSYYEKLCNISGNILKLKPDKEKALLLQNAIDTCHLKTTPMGVTSLSILAPLVIILFGSLLSYALFNSMFFVMFFLIVGGVIIVPLGKLPLFFADSWRLKASNQMVLCIFYIVTYMRHTSNLENAIDFAGQHLAPPLSIDLKKVLWDVESGNYDSIKDSIENYLKTWKKYNMEFIEAFHLIESSLYESSEGRRLESLDKSLEVILDETYEKMLHYAHNLKTPITMLHMLGIILPILGLVILPLVVSFMDNVKWYHLSALYNVALPVGVYLMGKSILSKRPTGYGDTDISENNPELKKYKKFSIKLGKTEILISPFMIGVLIFGVLFLIGLFPLILHTLSPNFDIPIGANFELLGYRLSDDGETQIGPFGLGASILGLFLTLSFGAGMGIYYRIKSKNVIKIRNKSKQLEEEFASGLFQLGNRLGDGIPVEMAVEKVSAMMDGTVSGNFFALVSQNIRRLGLSVEQAIFDPKIGALIYYPSSIIESTMKVLIQSMKKGPKVAAQALINVSRYIKEIHKVNERLHDLMADIVSSMNSQIKFLTPVIASIVIGITSMITSILGKLSKQMSAISSGSEYGGQIGGAGGILNLFGDGVPTYYFQIIVGLYVVQIIYILTIMVNGIENGEDKLNQKYLLGQNMIKGPMLYCITSAIIMVLFNLIAAQILTRTIG